MRFSLRIYCLIIFLTITRFVYGTAGLDSLYNLLGSADKSGKAEISLRIAEEYILINTDSASKYAGIALEIADKYGMVKEEAQACLIIGKVFVQKDNYYEAMVNSEKALQLYRSLDDRKGTAGALCDVGIVHYLLGDYDKALDYYLQALKIQEETEDMPGMVRSLNNISLIYSELENYDKALEYNFKCLEIAERSGNTEIIIKILINIGANYSIKKDFDKSNDYFQKALEYIEKEDMSTDGYYAILNNIGENYMSLDHPEKALDYFTGAMEKIKEIGQERGMAYSVVSISIGEAYIKLNDQDKAKEYLMEGLEVAKEINSKKMMQLAYLHLSRLFKSKGDYRKSLDYYSMFSEVKDSILNLETSNKVAELQTRYETEKKEKEIKMLNIERQLNDTKLSARTNWLIFFITGFIIILIFSVVFYIQKIKQQKTNKMLVRKNLEIVASEKQLLESIDKSRNTEADTGGQEAASGEKVKEEKGGKYSVSPLDEGQKQKIKKDILHAMEYDKIYLNNDISINKLAQHLNISRTYISQVINEKFNVNFTNFVNEYRIRDARRLLSDARNKKYTIESVARSVGFNSRPSFNSAFKKYTGITPSFYLRSVHGEQSIS